MFKWLQRKPKRRQVEHIDLGPNDTFLITCDRVLRAHEREMVFHAVRRFQLGELRALILDGDMRVTVIRRCADAT